MKRIKKYLLLLLLLGCMVASSIFLSYRYIGIYNPLSVLVGLVDVVILNNDYRQIQNEPKVVIANNHFDIERYMESIPYESEFDGVYELNNQTLYTFNIGEGQEIVEQVEKADFRIWKWR